MPPPVPPPARPQRLRAWLSNLDWNGPLAFGLLITGTALLWIIWPQEDSALAGNPAYAALQLVSEAPLTDVAPLYQLREDELIDCLRRQGLEVQGARQSLNDIADANDVPTTRIISHLMRGSRQ
ncbi:MAG: hypothetical protein GAK43_01741 [Stenotrophomonas maltophilia]|nr:MAG: hypothetical protein GAK43_01741 [Stenotrophomonas maltophilia]